MNAFCKVAISCGNTAVCLRVSLSRRKALSPWKSSFRVQSCLGSGGALKRATPCVAGQVSPQAVCWQMLTSFSTAHGKSEDRRAERLSSKFSGTVMAGEVGTSYR